GARPSRSLPSASRRRNPKSKIGSTFRRPAKRFAHDSGAPQNKILSRPRFSGHLAIMGQRREARERAVQFLFQHDLNPPEKLDEALDQFWDSQRLAAIAGEKAGATWGEKIELQPPGAEEAEMRLF